LCFTPRSIRSREAVPAFIKRWHHRCYGWRVRFNNCWNRLTSHFPCVFSAASLLSMSAIASATVPDAQGHFGPYGGRYVPETLMHPLQELEDEYLRCQQDPSFKREFDYYLREFCGRPTSLYFAERLTRELGGAKIYLKREDLLHTGAHKINNCIGQILLAKRMGK